MTGVLMVNLSALQMPVATTVVATLGAVSVVSLLTLVQPTASAAGVSQPPATQPPPETAQAQDEDQDETEPAVDADAGEEQAVGLVEPADDVFVYDSEGRRDPFVSLFNRGSNVPARSERPLGVAGLTVNEVALRGIVLSEGAYIAVLQAPDETTYIVRDGEQLYDGQVQSITADAVVFTQEVNDPLSLVTEREVRVTLRGVEEGR